MKTIKPKTTLISVLIASFFTSCLNNDSNLIESIQDLGYITTVNNTVCAATSCGYVTSPEIKSLRLNECYILGYEINDPAQNGIYTADNVFNISESPVPQTRLNIGTPPSENILSTESLDILSFAPTSYLGDRWLLKYSISLDDNEIAAANYYYDENNQIDARGDDISDENKVIIDVYFTKTDTLDNNDVADHGKYLSIGNLESLRSAYTPDYSRSTASQDGKKKVNVLLQFRYHKYVGANTTPEVSYLGNWDTDMTTDKRIYYMTFSQE